MFVCVCCLIKRDAQPRDGLQAWVMARCMAAFFVLFWLTDRDQRGPSGMIVYLGWHVFRCFSGILIIEREDARRGSKEGLMTFDAVVTR